jgi:hemerythrin
MVAISWDRRLETGCEEIDEQHRTLLDTLDRLHALAGRASLNHDEMEGLLIFLRDFTLVHFEAEQELMAGRGYPGEAEHRRIHSDLAREIDLLVDGYHRGTRNLSPVTLEYLDGWLQRHIQEEDFRLADFLRNAKAQTRG